MRIIKLTAYCCSTFILFFKVFEQLPVEAIIEERILCIHGGIGGSINSISDIAELRRPLCVAQVPTNDTVRQLINN